MKVNRVAVGRNQCRSATLCFIADDNDRARRLAQDLLRRAPEQYFAEPAAPVQSDHHGFRIEFLRQAHEGVRHGHVVGDGETFGFQPLDRSTSYAVRKSSGATGESRTLAGMAARSNARPASQTTTTSARRGASRPAASCTARSATGVPSNPMITGPEDMSFPDCG
jgi:hypothetical protein